MLHRILACLLFDRDLHHRGRRRKPRGVSAVDEVHLLVSDSNPGVRVITLSWPDERNVLSSPLLAAIAGSLESARDDATVRCAVIAGGDTVFSAGADIKELSRRDTVVALLDVRPGIWDRIRNFPKPPIAAVNGFALGGCCELAMQADIIPAGEGAKFGQPEVNLGIIPPAGRETRSCTPPLRPWVCDPGSSLPLREKSSTPQVGRRQYVWWICAELSHHWQGENAMELRQSANARGTGRKD